MEVDGFSQNESYIPGKRRGASSCVSKDREKVYMFRGYPGDRNGRDIAENHIAVFDFDKRSWTKETFDAGSKNPPVDAGACCTIINDRLYMFGGWQVGQLNNEVYELNLDTIAWRQIEPIDTSNEPLLKNKCGIIPYGNDMLCIFGGYGYPVVDGILQKGAKYDWERPLMGGIWIGWTNELHLFHLKKRIWIVPQTAGVPPKPCAAFSFNRIDRHRVLLFGGRQKAERVNEIHVLDMATWQWSGAIIPTGPEQPWPKKRSLQTTCSLYDPQYVPIVGEQTKVVPNHFQWLPCEPPNLSNNNKDISYTIEGQQILLLWGMDNKGDPINDSWILNINTMTWKQFYLPSHLSPRIWHVSECLYTAPNECLIMTFGGATDNLFNQPEITTPTSCETLIFKFGISSLYKLCQQFLLSLYRDDISILQPLLPLHIFSQLSKIKEQETNGCSVLNVQYLSNNIDDEYVII